MSNPSSLQHYMFKLPHELIAQEPINPRDHSRLMVINTKMGNIQHKKFFELPEFLKKNDLIIGNNSKVIRARLLGHRVASENPRTLGGKLECFLLRRLQQEKGLDFSHRQVWEALIKVGSTAREGLEFKITSPKGEGGLRGRILRHVLDRGSFWVEFSEDPLSKAWGYIPLPPYLDKASQERAENVYQTTFAKNDGSVAAPTAGLHFTHELCKKIESIGVHWQELTLHVGYGTFRPIKVDDFCKHEMHEEYYEISPELAAAWKSSQKKIIIGTTTLRGIESTIREHGELKSGHFSTKIFLHPLDGQEIVSRPDALITNFHLPGSSLFLLVCRLIGRDLALRAYEAAMAQKYRFFSYGDAMLLDFRS